MMWHIVHLLSLIGRFLKVFYYLNLCWTSAFYCDPVLTPEATIWTIIYLYMYNLYSWFHDALSLHFVIFGIMVLRRKIFKDIQKIFAIDQLYLLAWHYVCINLNPNHTGLLCVRFGWNWPKDLKRWKCEKFGQGRPIDKFWLKNFWLMWANILSKSILTTKLV